MMQIKNNANSATHLANSLLAMRGTTPVFDLDGVLLDASHRMLFNEDGSLDLDHYRAHMTEDEIAQDKSLPLIEVIHSLNQAGRNYHVCTARVMCQHSRKLLRDNNIFPEHIMCRDGEHDHRKDWQLKTAKLTALFDDRQRENMVLIDDCKGNIKAAKQLGMKAIHVDYTFSAAQKLAADQLGEELRKLDESRLNIRPLL